MSKLGSRFSLKPQNSRLLLDQSLIGTSTDQSDGEWTSLRSRISVEKEVIALADSRIDAALLELSDDGSDADELALAVAEKEAEVARLTDRLLDLEARFVWDLSLAVKMQVVSEHMNQPGLADELSCVDLHELVRKIQLDPFDSGFWTSDIRQGIQTSLETG
jgi:hypothetical protein